jgi:hypothetical protein
VCQKLTLKFRHRRTQALNIFQLHRANTTQESYKLKSFTSSLRLMSTL